MRILITNDDGYDAPGLAALREALTGLGEITVVAPALNRSGASSSLTLSEEILVDKQEGHFYIVHGTPTDCIHLALSGDFLPHKPDLVVSGINDGANMGDDTIYSGTVAAAMESHLFHLPAVAFSMARKPAQHFATGASVARRLIESCLSCPPPENVLLNVNVPDVPLEDVGHTQITRLGRRHVAEPAILRRAEGDRRYYVIGEAGDAKDGGPGTDFHALQSGDVSISPLMVDLTHMVQMEAVKKWLLL